MSASTHITDDTTIEGNLTTASALTVAGEIRGDVTAGGTVTLMEDGAIHGNVSGTDVLIQGTVEGRITASGRLVLSRSAVVKGDVSCRSLQIDEGGTLLGRCDMGKAPEAKAEPVKSTAATTGPRRTLQAPTAPTAPRAGMGLPPPPAFGGAPG